MIAIPSRLSPYDMTPAADPRIPYCYGDTITISVIRVVWAIYQSFGNWPNARVEREKGVDPRADSESQQCGNIGYQILSY
jgi:hypothetical protein